MEIQINSLSKVYKNKIRGDKKALNNVNLRLESPSLVGLLGPNGAGKSTLMKLMVRQLLPSAGNIVVDGQDLKDSEMYFKSKLGYLPQEFGLYDDMTVKEFLIYMACVKEVNDNREELINKSMENTGIIEKKDCKIKTLSGGQKQRVGIAQALLNDPEIFIVDEPTVGLDPEERIKFRNLFSDYATSKLIILSTHIIDDIESVCNRLIVMNKGSIVFDGIPGDFVKKVEGLVGVIEVEGNTKLASNDKYEVISRVTIEEGIKYRLVGDDLPQNCQIVEPTLEDAYMYCIREGAQS